uniref:Aminopeptidase n=1 Tax=Strongyloides venezuelensis TaxID=75913 RepID=A0A0K0F0I2_STRVS
MTSQDKEQTEVFFTTNNNEVISSKEKNNFNIIRGKSFIIIIMIGGILFFIAGFLLINFGDEIFHPHAQYNDDPFNSVFQYLNKDKNRTSTGFLEPGLRNDNLNEFPSIYVTHSPKNINLPIWRKNFISGNKSMPLYINSTSYTLSSIHTRSKGITLTPYLYDIIFQIYYDRILTEKNEPQYKYKSLVVNITIYLHCHKRTNIIKLNQKNLTLWDRSFKLEKISNGVNENIDLINVILNDPHETLEFIASKDLIPSNNYSLSLAYSVSLDHDDLAGLYKMTYRTNSSVDGIVLGTQLQTEFARRLFPCYDQPDMKAEFLISVRHPTSAKVISNSPPRLTETSGNGYETTYFYKTKKMSTYLLAVVISFFRYKETIHNDIPIRIYTEPMKIDGVNLALETTKKLLQYYENYFDIKYPLPKLDIHTFPQMRVHAMENWGIITIKTDHLIYQKDVHTYKHRYEIIKTISHETSHMWFGCLVTPTNWDLLWLNEGFATFMSFKGAEGIGSEKTLSDGLYYFDLQNVCMEMDQRFSNTHPIIPRVRNTKYIVKNKILYLKSALILFMIEEVIGEEIFRESLHQFIKENAYKNVNNQQLLETMEYVLEKRKGDNILLPKNITLTKFVEDWILQEGFPLVTVTKNKDNSLNLVQEVMDSEHNKNNRFANKWTIPIFIQDNVPENYSIKWIVTGENLTIHQYSLPLDPHCRGYYRIRYTNDIYDEFYHTLITNHTSISTPSRARLIDDAFYLAEFNYIDYSIPLKLIQYFTREKHYVPLAVFFKHFKNLKKIYGQESFFEHFTNYTNELLKCTYKYVNSKEFTNDKSFVGFSLISDVTSYVCDNGDVECINESLKLFNNLKIICAQSRLSNSSCNTIPTYRKQIVYQAAARYGDDSAFDFLLRKYKEEDYGTEKKIIRAALLCTKNEHLFLMFLKNSLFELDGMPLLGDLRQFVYDVYVFSSHGRIVKKLIMDKTYFEALYVKYKSIPIHFSYFFKFLNAYCDNDEQYEELKSFYQREDENVKQLGTAVMTEIKKNLIECQKRIKHRKSKNFKRLEQALFEVKKSNTNKCD